MRLKGKTALITGAARGIGLAFAKAYVAEGARVAIADINLPAAQAAAGEIGSGAIAVEMNVADKASIDAGVAATVAALGQIDILINNAAIFSAAPITEITQDDYTRVFDINVGGTLFTMQAVSEHTSAPGEGGESIKIGSHAGRRGGNLFAGYLAREGSGGAAGRGRGEKSGGGG